MTFLQQDSFQRPASYWLRRADRCKQNGDFLRAAVLERHALRADPVSEEASVSYVLTLRQLSCYEASNREAFAALARNPDNKTLYGLIGQNLLAIGQKDAGADALNIYLSQPMPDFPPMWHDDAYDLACDCDDLPKRRRKARHDGLLEIAAQRMRRNDPANARRALERCSRAPYQGRSAKRELMWTLYHLQTGSPECFDHLMNAIAARPYSAQVHASAAGALWKMGLKKPAYTELVTASRLASSPSDMLGVLMSAEEMQAEHLATPMLRRMNRHTPNRTPVLYNLCACLCRLGRLEDAVPFVDRLRQIDPDDVQAELLFADVMNLQSRSAAPDEVRQRAKDFSWYGLFTGPYLNRIAAPIAEAASQSAEHLSNLLISDLSIRRRFLTLLTMPMPWHAQLLYTVCSLMPAEEQKALLREVLLQHPAPSAAKNCAAAMLAELGAPPPYASWQDGRIAWADPTRAPSETAAFRPRLLTLRLHRAQQLCPRDPHIALWGMEMVHRMTKHQRSRVIADPARIWPMALAMRYRSIRGMEPLHVDIARMGRARRQALLEALALLRRLSVK